MTRRSRFLAVSAGIALAAGLAGCGVLTDKITPPEKPSITFESNVSAGQDDVTVDTLVRVSATDGTIATVALKSDKGAVPIEQRGDAWVAQARLEPGTAYTLTASGTGEDGSTKTWKRPFRTEALTLNQQTYPSVSPLTDDTVGVAMPVIVRFDLPVQNRELYEKNMIVESSQPAEGRWAWFGDREVHYRTKDYWPANTDVTVKVLVNSLPAGNGIYGQQDQIVKFHVGRKVVGYVDINRYTLTVKADDRVLRTIPVSTGDTKHRTRQGTKVIMEKLRKVDMDAATTGVDSEDDDYYDLEDVEYAMRLTNSGEFLHAAPWSVASQGRANVSHGCTGMSTANAEWLFGQMKKGDPVEYTGSPRPIEQGNGWTDWNISWDDWVKKSALKVTPSPSVPSPAAGAPSSFAPPGGGAPSTDQRSPR
ncbi:MAG TPA: Ig-like domain-containing protein [Aeromicrobium sp.]|nr:Ig-like domain-containing protein [Aeromicrobium sp.]HKY57838.1 Ig-like domain-containing protein [Aeromicrobium sp.]